MSKAVKIFLPFLFFNSPSGNLSQRNNSKYGKTESGKMFKMTLFITVKILETVSKANKIMTKSIWEMDGNVLY